MPTTPASSNAKVQPGRHRRIGQLRLRGRLLAAQLALAGLVGLSGGAGLWVINGIGRTVANYSETTAPLVEQSALLRQEAQRARLTLFEALSRSRNDEPASRANLDNFNRESEQGLSRVSELLKRAGIDADANPAVLALAAFAHYATEILDARKAEVEAWQSLSATVDRFDQQIRDLDTQLLALAAQSETRMSEREDRAKTLVQSSRATVEALGQVLDETFNENYPIVQGAYKLMRYTVLIQEAARSATSNDDDVHLLQVEKQVRQYLATARSLQSRVIARLPAPAKAEFGKVRGGFENLEALLLSDEGLLATQRKGVAARSQLRALRLMLAKAQNTYSEELEKIERSAAQFNDNARKATMLSVGAANTTVGIIVAVALVLAIVFGFTFARRLTGPLTRLTADMRRLAQGDLDGEPTVYRSRDEIAEMLEALEVFRDTARRDQAFAAARDEEQRKKEARQTATDRHIREFDAAVTQSLGTFFQAATDMRATADNMAKTADDTSRQAATVSVAAQDASQNVGAVATAADELSLSTSEISRQISHSASIAGKALDESERAHAIVRGFADAAGKIGNIVTVIEDVAQRTNLLALNATIEAARAGAAGRGFGVVAVEVKELATQTGAATNEIKSQIDAIQSAAQDVVAAIAGIGTTIRDMSEASNAIGSAAEQQRATTQEIARAVQETAQRTAQVTASIGHVDHGAGLTGSAASQVLKTANELGVLSQALRMRIEKFFSDLRAA